MNNKFILMNKYVINTEKLLLHSKENPEYYKFIIKLVDKYLDILNNMNDVSLGLPNLRYMPEYRNVIENTLLSDNILISIRKSKIEKILNAK